MRKWLRSRLTLKPTFKIAHHSHSMRLRPHEHTSYGPLLLLLLMVGVVLMIGTVNAETPYDGPEAESIGLSGTVPAKPPTVAAVITSPTNGQRFTTSPITVKGTCPATTLVQIYKNDIFAGSTPCEKNGTFQMEIDLLIGQNVLVARVYNELNEPGPDSNLVTVFYDALPPKASPLGRLNFGGTQMILVTDSVFRGAFPEKDMVVPLTIIGGVPPYAVNIQWGDSTNTVVPRGDNLTFKTAHVYKKPGVYQLVFQATDSQGRVAFLSVAAIVNGQPSAIPVAGSTAEEDKLMLLWPFLAAAIAAVISFWLGERREKKILMKRGFGGRGPLYKNKPPATPAAPVAPAAST